MLTAFLTVSAQGVPRPEYPCPQFQRDSWINLNGEWTYSFDFGNSGKQRGFEKSKGFPDKIIVPFCPESSLSGVSHKDFINYMWYQRTITVPPEWQGKKVILHFGAVYYKAEVFIDGKFVGRHWGGTSSFELDVTSCMRVGHSHNLVVYVSDDLRSGKQTGGKQCFNYYSEGCSYTRTTGIWQTVWMEAVDPFGLKSCHIIPDIDQQQVVIEPCFFNESNRHLLKVTIKDKGKVVARKIVRAVNSSVCVISIPKAKTWSPENPFLYGINFEILDNNQQVVDDVKSYFGMRKVHIEGDRVFLNNKPYYQRLVLDQGFYPDGIWTAPSDSALKHDIELSQQAGFNGARLHQKIFEDRYFYWADRLGYLTWAESSSWGADLNDQEAVRNFMTEWSENVMDKRNHPSIIIWTPLNESWGTDVEQYPRFVKDIYTLTKGLDPTRPVNDASGGTHVITDIWSVHSYEHNSIVLAKVLTPNATGIPWSNETPHTFASYSGQPYLIDECGGIKWNPDENVNDTFKSWGYGDAPKSYEEFYKQLEGVIDAILSRKNVCGFCYTQLTDVEQEQNGIYRYNRFAKFDMKRVHAILSKNSNFNKCEKHANK